MKRQKYKTMKDELPMLASVQYSTEEVSRYNSRKNEEMESKPKQWPVVDMTGDGIKAQSCKGQYCIWNWNVRSRNQGKLEVVKQEMARVNNINILEISELKWTGMGDFNSDDHYFSTVGKNPLEEMG